MARSLNRGGRPTRSLRAQIDGGSLTDVWGTMNLIQGTGITMSAVDNSGQQRMDVTINSSASGLIESSFTILNPGVTAAQINTALSTYDVVYLTPGNYGVMSTAIQMNSYNQLIGLGGGGSIGSISYGAILQVNSNITLINMSGGNNRIENISLWGNHAGTQDLVVVSGGANRRAHIKDCFFGVSNWQGRLINSTSPVNIENVGMDSFSRTGSASVLRISASGGASYAPSTLKNVYIDFPTGGASSRIGFDITASGFTVTNCKVQNAGSHGFSFSENSEMNSMFVGCSADNCGGDGFVHSNPGWWLGIIGCNAYNNAGRGFNLPFGAAGRLFGVIVGCVAQNSTGGNTVSTGYLNTGNSLA